MARRSSGALRAYRQSPSQTSTIPTSLPLCGWPESILAIDRHVGGHPFTTVLPRCVHLMIRAEPHSSFTLQEAPGSCLGLTSLDGGFSLRLPGRRWHRRWTRPLRCCNALIGGARNDRSREQQGKQGQEAG